MIITKTPFRLSLLGGGSDYRSWSSVHSGLVLGGAINRHCYLSARFLPGFHDHKTRVVYSKIEEVQYNQDIEHRAIYACIQKMGLQAAGLEIFHSSDLPGRSGMGSSSSFVVGLLHALGALQGRLTLPHELARMAMSVEQEMLGETVGCQDQVFAAHGGLNLLRFRTDGEISVEPLALSREHIQGLEEHLMLFFTKMPRTSSSIAATYAPTLADKTREMFALMKLAEQGLGAVYHKKWELLGRLIDQSWRIKASLSDAVTNRAIDDLYIKARLAGAWGGKLTGAGGGGSLLLVAPPEKHAAIQAALPELVHIPFRFSIGGSTIVYSDGDSYEHRLAG